MQMDVDLQASWYGIGRDFGKLNERKEVLTAANPLHSGPSRNSYEGTG